MGKKYYFAIIFIVLTAITASGYIALNKPHPAMVKYATTGFAVVELFTSEGCSSCPAADKAVAALLAKNSRNVFILAYHVDYWDRLGWKDPFSTPAYSQRQNQYAYVFNLESVYTPQVIINGSSQFVGSDEEKLNNVVGKNLQSQQPRLFSIELVKGDGRVSINYDMGEGDLLLNIALVQPEADIPVKRGENSGRTLHHVNIVRALKTIEGKSKGSTILDIPPALAGTALEIISYTQEKKTLKILGADKQMF